MTELYEILAERVAEWRKAGYPCPYPTIGEILEFAIEGEAEEKPFPLSGNLRYLRAPQLRALETYWYLRLVEGTARVETLYERMFARPSDRRKALGLDEKVFAEVVENEGIEGLLRLIRTDDAFVVQHRLEALREGLFLDYPSYILALAMGAGKTVLIGSIIATEFAMALEHPGEDVQFVENALVFAPGKTILEALRELTRMPFEHILPPRLNKQFAAAHRIVFTRDGDPDIPVMPGSSFNIVVTNTEKIRIQARPARRSKALLQPELLDERAREEANRRLTAVASLPHLAVFSDEAHHTYGQEIGDRLKRVRRTIDHLHQRTNLICVINTTGTPYFGRQPLKDVVVWYGLGQGIRDGILKEVAGNIQSFQFRNDQAGDFVAHVVRDFFETYGGVALADGSAAKIAIYFPQTEDLDELRPRIELALSDARVGTAVALTHTSKTGRAAEDAFNRLNDPSSPHRVILLVNKGTEGWNCPSLFATALARRLTSKGNNFVLQAASRCLRQVPGNDLAARIYLSADNRAILDKQLQETYGENIADLDRRLRETKVDRIRLDPVKAQVPPLIIRRARQLRERTAVAGQIEFRRPSGSERPDLLGTVFDVGIQVSSRRVLRAVGTIEVESTVDAVDQFTAAVALAANTRLDVVEVLDGIRGTYGDEDVPVDDLIELERQLEDLTTNYKIVEVEEEVALHLVKFDGFHREELADGRVAYAADISYPADRADIVVGPDRLLRENAAGYGFHYTPYNFDTHPEAAYFEQLIRVLNRDGARVTDVYFTGGLTSGAKTDLRFEYRRRDGRIGEYTPDFVVRCGDGKWLLVEVKRSSVELDEIEGRQGRKAAAINALVERNPDALDYQMVFTATDSVTTSDLDRARKFARDCEPA